MKRTVAAVVVCLGVALGVNYTPRAQELETSIDNNQPFRNPAGHAATFSTQGSIDLTGEYFQAQGTTAGAVRHVNNGTSLNNILFDIRTASAAARTPDLPLYTFQNRVTGETRQLTDAGRGNITGAWADLGHFKTPTLRALAARAPYFHNGMAATLEDVVRHYETHVGFIFTDEQRADLVAFLKAL